ncbi:Uncharacterised protein [uncultured archaeon]|nr:Uncharacterised protein [uncultured archaeon]
MRAQASSEYLLIMAVLSAAVLPFLLVLAWNAAQQPEQLAMTMATASASRLAAAVNSVGSLGPGAALRTQVEMPNGVTLNATGHEITVHINTAIGPMDLVQPTYFPVNGSGLERVQAGGTYIIDVYGPTSPDAPNVTLVLN